MATLRRAGIRRAYFERGTLYVPSAQINDAGEALENDPNLTKLPPVEAIEDYIFTPPEEAVVREGAPNVHDTPNWLSRVPADQARAEMARLRTSGVRYPRAVYRDKSGQKRYYGRGIKHSAGDEHPIKSGHALKKHATHADIYNRGYSTEGLVAQLAEQTALNRQVIGSSPIQPTISSSRTRQLVRSLTESVADAPMASLELGGHTVEVYHLPSDGGKDYIAYIDGEPDDRTEADTTDTCVRLATSVVRRFFNNRPVGVKSRTIGS